jgi:endonuclease/exonuclease/phosphatase family metal-dependent hydrolase
MPPRGGPAVTRARFFLGLCLAVFLGSLLGAARPAGAVPSATIVISQVYGGGGNTGALYKNDFIELFNRGTASVPVDGWSVQYASASGTTWQVTPLSGTILPGQYYLVRQAAGAGGTVDLPPPDATGSIAMSATVGKVALVSSTTSLSPAACPLASTVDFVGYGAANCWETTPAPGPAPGLSNTTADLRNPPAPGPRGCQDTDINSADFTAGAPEPRNRQSPRTFCVGDAAPFVIATTPAPGQGEVPQSASITITFSEPVTAGANAFSITCDGESIAFAVTPTGPSTTFVLTPTSPLPQEAECTVAVEGDQVSDVDELDPPDAGADYSFTFTTQGRSGLRIHDIQGRQHLSPHRGVIVSAVPGIVTARRLNGFYYQDPIPDLDPRTSEGIFVFTGAAPPGSVTVGAPVTVSGRVTEFRGGCTPSCAPPNYDIDPYDPGSSAFGNLTTTQINATVVTPWTGVGTISPTVVGRGGVVPPPIVIDDDTPDPAVDDPPLVSGNVESKSSPPGVAHPQDPTFDPWEDGIDFHESVEGMLVQINNAVAVSPTVDFSVNASRPRGTNSEIAVLADRGRNAVLRTFRGGIIVRGFDQRPPQEYRFGDFNPERLILNDPILREQGQTAPAVDVRDTFGEPIRAIVDYSFGNFKYLMLNNQPAFDGGLRPEVTRPARRDELSIATYNVENLDPLLDSERMPLIARQIIDNLRSPDILALVEMQDFDGEGPGGPAGDTTFAALAQAIASEGGPTYQWRQIDPVHNEDGGIPNGNIRVGFMFRTDRGLTFPDRPGGTAVTPTEDNPAIPGAQLTFNPGRVDPNNAVWRESRKPLAAEFLWRGRKIFLVASHFTSKTGDQPLMGRFQEPMRPSEIQRRGKTMPVDDPQRGQAGVVNVWVRRLLVVDPRADIVVLGDLNDFHFSLTNRFLERGGDRSFELFNLYRFHPRPDRYSYVFQGNSQDLDHVLVSPHLLRSRRGFDPVHINSEFFDQVSDHDSLVVRVRLGDGDDDDDDDDDEEDDDSSDDD